MVVCVYVDDVIYMESSPSFVAGCMMHVFQIRGFGIWPQINAADRLLQQFNLSNCKAVYSHAFLQAEDGSRSADARVRNVLADLGHQQKEVTRISCENADMSKNTLQHGRKEHIEVKLEDFTRELVAGDLHLFHELRCS
ncbi:hypothetical protein SASPL_104082 [Salvia splendens]|uniref:Uncharacterized protein n=1 Tax=Salvia splendens TaxID=180675 RepID=A0A8X8YIN8_SALSN|nr:uncharacterized protein LOC121760122 [Salvia splendens]KAG6432505.1 hypothetical protein SASPL_104082 [Salvia splendens]